MEYLLELLRRLGIGRRFKGYRAAVAAVRRIVENEGRLHNVMRDVYIPVAKEVGGTWSTVERNLRTIIRVAWKKNRPLLNELAGYELPREPTVTEFLEILARPFWQKADAGRLSPPVEG